MLNVFMHYLPLKKLRQPHVPDYGPGWLAGIIVKNGRILTNKFGSSFLFRTIRVSFPICRTFVTVIGLIQFFSNPLYCLQIDTQTFLNHRIGASSVNTKEYRMLFLDFWTNKLRHGAVFFTDSAQLNLVCYTVDKTRKNLVRARN